MLLAPIVENFSLLLAGQLFLLAVGVLVSLLFVYGYIYAHYKDV